MSYNKLWKLLIDKNMYRKDLQEFAGINSASIAKLGNGSNITTDILLKICKTLDCHIEDILETIDEK
ncbi:MAG: helix-turn-helix transcriptional regulator [Finegoldia magna]|nr:MULTISPECIES: helix-turn-helix transcriptional regulator [Bacillota]MDU2566503.1 helix-turn-helix transcriptional regulator [Anaerococcus sp.]MDU7478692.1 helix-turn-helix transcriptional regulator [Finegoldia magna]MDU7502142.1 helix-turn-helix transcriptional regulator [Finegoldia magna]